MIENTRQRVCVIGPGMRFLSGISYYTYRLAQELAHSHDVSVVLMRQLLPTRFYPGRHRVGARLTRLSYAPTIPVFDGVDWYWLPSMLRALAFLIRHRPQHIVLQWWSGTVLHSYLLLAITARLLGARVTIEFHEALDPGELRIPLVRAYLRAMAPALIGLAQGFVVHSHNDRADLSERYRFGSRPTVVIHHGSFDHYRHTAPRARQASSPGACCHLLYFGVIRPYKGLEDLIVAFDALPVEDAARYRLTIVGETWENWTLPRELIARSPYRDRITFVNRYVSDGEVGAVFSEADAVVLPYHRSSASGPLHVAMSYGLPVVVTRVGGLLEAVLGYEGAILVAPRDPSAIRDAILQVAGLQGKRFTDPRSWDRTVDQYNGLFKALRGAQLSVEDALPHVAESDV